jgi:hypothetical protein
MNTGPDIVIEVNVHDRATMDSGLDAAVARMIEVARRDRGRGILITRLRDGHFTVRLSEAVTFGYTKQVDARNRSL